MAGALKSHRRCSRRRPAPRGRVRRDPLGPGLLREGPKLALQTRFVPAELPRKDVAHTAHGRALAVSVTGPLPVSWRAASSPRRVRRRSTSPIERACSRRAASATSASRSGEPAAIG